MESEKRKDELLSNPQFANRDECLSNVEICKLFTPGGGKKKW